MQSQDDQPPGANDATLVAPRAQQGSARLIVRRADGQLKEYGLDKDEITIGRLATNDVALPDDRSVSRRHAVIRRSNVGYVIEDQQSNNGTYVDGEKILYPFVLHNGQSIKVGSNELTFTMVSAMIQPAPAGAENQPAVAAQAAAPEAQEPFYNPPIPQPSFDAPPQPAFNASSQPAFNAPPQPGAFPAPPGMDQPAVPFEQPLAAPAFQQPPPGPAYQPAQPFGQPPAPEQPFGQPGGAFPAPQQPGMPPYAQAPGFPPSPAPAAETGKVICQNCGQPTMANKAFCLNCGASMAAQSAPMGQVSGGVNPYGAPPSFGGPTAPPTPGPGSQPWPAPSPSQPQPWPQQPQGQQPLQGVQPWPPQPPGQPPVGAQPWPPQPQGQQPPPGQPQPWPPQSPGAPQGWPGQPGQQPGPFGAGPQAPAPAAGPFDGTVFFPKGLRPIQPSDIKVRLAATQFGGPSSLQPGTNITVRVWSAAQDAFYFAAPGITMRVPAPGGVEEGSVQATPLRPTAPGATDQLLFIVVDANSGQPLHPSPIAADVVIAYQPAPPFDGPGSLKLPI